MKVTKQISITKAGSEWEIINKKVKESGKKDFSSYVRCEILKIKKILPEGNSYELNNTSKKERRVCLPPHLYDNLTPLADYMGLSVSNLVERLIIDPLLLPENIKP